MISQANAIRAYDEGRTAAREWAAEDGPALAGALTAFRADKLNLRALEAHWIDGWLDETSMDKEYEEGQPEPSDEAPEWARRLGVA